MNQGKITIRKIILDSSFYYEVEILKTRESFKVTIENPNNPFMSKVIFIPNILSEKLKIKIHKLIKRYENEYGETLND